MRFHLYSRGKRRDVAEHTRWPSETTYAIGECGTPGKRWTANEIACPAGPGERRSRMRTDYTRRNMLSPFHFSHHKSFLQPLSLHRLPLPRHLLPRRPHRMPPGRSQRVAGKGTATWAPRTKKGGRTTAAALPSRWRCSSIRRHALHTDGTAQTSGNQILASD